ncbi:MAG: excinuclease ABC subunit B, partial [Chlorobiaceae bacterium]|nr:excinuclease ABC subunit B [Chlorobiaceae bacterium]
LDTTSVADAEERFRRKRFGLEPKPDRLLAGVLDSITSEEGHAMAEEMRVEMYEAALEMEYEKAAYLRDEIAKLEQALQKLPSGEQS